jgi:hypothetical protein
VLLNLAAELFRQYDNILVLPRIGLLILPIFPEIPEFQVLHESEAGPTDDQRLGVLFIIGEIERRIEDSFKAGDQPLVVTAVFGQGEGFKDRRGRPEANHAAWWPEGLIISCLPV